MSCDPAGGLPAVVWAHLSEDIQFLSSSLRRYSPHLHFFMSAGQNGWPEVAPKPATLVADCWRIAPFGWTRSGLLIAETLCWMTTVPTWGHCSYSGTCVTIRSGIAGVFSIPAWHEGFVGPHKQARLMASMQPVSPSSHSPSAVANQICPREFTSGDFYWPGKLNKRITMEEELMHQTCEHRLKRSSVFLFSVVKCTFNMNPSSQLANVFLLLVIWREGRWSSK